MAQADQVKPDEIAVFNDSLYRCLQNGDFVGRFYELFMSSSPDVRAKFRHTDFKQQKRVLRQSLYMMSMAVEGDSAALTHVRRIAARHGRRELDIGPELYDLWLESLIRTVSDHDPQFSETVEMAWRNMMAFGIELMKAEY